MKPIRAAGRYLNQQADRYTERSIAREKSWVADGHDSVRRTHVRGHGPSAALCCAALRGRTRSLLPPDRVKYGAAVSHPGWECARAEVCAERHRGRSGHRAGADVVHFHGLSVGVHRP